MSAKSHSAIGVTAMLADEFNLLHGGTYDTENPPPPDQLFQAIHALPKGERRTALCLSGGGIRSASFALGVLQGLAKAKILGEFHYLSTVSGGGYIGAWLSVWRSRIKDDGALMEMLSGRRNREAAVLQEAETRLNAPQGQRYKPEDAHREPMELTLLREHSNFLTPKLGAMSADTWTLIALYLRNLLLNWAVFLPLILAALLAPIITRDVLSAANTGLTLLHHFVLLAAIGLFIFAVYTSVRGRLARDSKDRVDQGAFLWHELLPIYVAAMLVSLYSVGECNTQGTSKECWATRIGPGLASIAGAVVYAAGWFLAYWRFCRHEGDRALPSLADPFPRMWLSLPWIAAGFIAGALVGLGLDEARNHLEDTRPIAILGVGWIAVSIFLANAVYLAVTSFARLGDVEREWLARSSGWFVAMTVMWAGFAALVLYADYLLALVQLKWGVLIGGGVGAAAAWIGSSARTLAGFFPGKSGERLPMSTVLALASAIFLVALVVVLSHFLPGLRDGLASLIGWQHRVLTDVLGLLFCLLFVAVVAWFVNVNRFSAHSLYRNRLIRAFMGAARGPEGQFGKTADPFTGFDQKDNVFVKDLVYPTTKARLFPVINMALNTVAGSNNAWQERKAESFSVTPRRSGNEWVKYWPTENYGSREKGLGLGTAIAISGAAASPNQGYHSSPLVGLVMTLFNVRLGWWLGNPSWPHAAPRESPRFSMVQFIFELFGLTNDRREYVYLSDGGHFENLGLYEMVRRRSHFILVSDAGCDPNCAFEDLGNAVRKIQIDLGVTISFKKLLINKRNEPSSAEGDVYCAVGTIKYPEEKAPLGHLLYLKPAFFGTEPADVRAYAAASKTFPHETTADQFFSESQMESYRTLGLHVVDTVLGEPADTAHADPPLAALGLYWARVNSFAA